MISSELKQLKNASKIPMKEKKNMDDNYYAMDVDLSMMLNHMCYE